MNLLFLRGTPDDGKCVVDINSAGETIHYLSGCCNVGPFITKKLGGSNCHELFLSGINSSQSFNLNFWPSIIFNEISDPDTHSVALEKANIFCQNQKKPVLNSPASVLATKRDTIYKNLTHIENLTVPKTFRISPRSPSEIADFIEINKLKFPLIFRQAGDHGGKSTCLFKSVDEITSNTFSYALDGRVYYLTEFFDFASQDGFYRKYRLAVVGDDFYLRHQIISDDWLIHSSSRLFMNMNPQFIQEEKNCLENFESKLKPLFKKQVKEIISILKLDYFGIDCGLDKDGQVIVFEVNPSMNILINNQPVPNIWQQPVEQITNKLIKLIIERQSA
jgi:glutathione synthase/RimK-type ligase-like ATP-grasp enzyme